MRKARSDSSASGRSSAPCGSGGMPVPSRSRRRPGYREPHGGDRGAATAARRDARRAGRMKTARATRPGTCPVAGAAPAATGSTGPGPQTAARLNANDRRGPDGGGGVRLGVTGAAEVAQISGQINPAFNMVDDGVSTDVYIVDNEPRAHASASTWTHRSGRRPRSDDRVRRQPEQLVRRVAARAQHRRELKVRKAEVTVRNDRSGRLLLGKGSGSRRRHRRIRPVPGRRADHVSGVADIAGGIIFTDGSDLVNLGTKDDPTS